jgi:basic membrane lipoprotein Med (substrate-binding protein (PBP1-ABC) superfamily)
MASTSYQQALRLGQKEARACLSRGEDPYLPALESIVPSLSTLNEESLGVVQVYLDQVVGTRTESRRNAFSRSFYPLLEEHSEFADKWSSLARHHLNEGIQDPIIALEYLNHFYVVEGHKRVSVMRAYGAPTIQANVTRILPPKSDTLESQVYYEFLDFYRITHVNFIQFHDLGKYPHLLALLDPEAQEVWDMERRREFSAAAALFRQCLRSSSAKGIHDPDEALLRYLSIFGYSHLQSRTPTQLRSELESILTELVSETTGSGPTLLMEPEEGHGGSTSRSLLDRLRKPAQPLKIAFLHDKSATASYWTYAHEEGRRFLDQVFGDRIQTASYFNMLQEDPAARIRQLVEDGVQMIFTTTPRLLDATLNAAAKFPHVKFLNCSLNISHPIVRTYYGRMYEAKFLTGVIAGALSENGRIGYVTNYPIRGSVASINAFALGAQMANPSAQVYLEWSTIPNVNIGARFQWNQISVISGQDMCVSDTPRQNFGVFLVGHGKPHNVALSFWHWGEFYKRIIESVLDGSWSNLNAATDAGHAINYWWGLSSGVIDIKYNHAVPPQTAKLVELLRGSIMDGSFLPFEGPVYDHHGRLRIQPDQTLMPDEIIQMDWLVSNVVGSLPDPQELTPDAQALVRILGIPRKDGLS